MIVLFTDFGLTGPYVGQIKGAIAAIVPNVPVIDLMHDAPPFEPQYCSYLLAAYAAGFATSAIFVAVVDPGVGGARDPLIIRADGKWFVGPDNGLFEATMRRARDVRTWRITWRPETLSASFHGRDLFAPTAAQIAAGGFPEGEPIDPETIRKPDWPDDLPAIVYIDHFGNAMTGLRASALHPEAVLKAGERFFSPARVFSDVAEGEAFWYENANGLAEIAVNRGRADLLGLSVGTAVSMSGPA